MTTKLESVPDTVETVDKKDLQRQIDSLHKETWLSEREAQISVLMKYAEEYDSLVELAEELGISKNTVYQHAYNINQKKIKSKRTLEQV